MARTTMFKSITFPLDLEEQLRRVAFEDHRSQSGILAESFTLFMQRRNGEEPVPEPDPLGI